MIMVLCRNTRTTCGTGIRGNSPDFQKNRFIKILKAEWPNSWTLVHYFNEALMYIVIFDSVIIDSAS